MGKVDDEQTKLLANALDRISTACVTVGIATPLAGWIYDVGAFRASLEIGSLATGLFGWVFVAVGLHIAARRVLRGLRP